MARKAASIGSFLLLVVVLSAPVALAQRPASNDGPVAGPSSGKANPQLNAIRAEIEHGGYTKAESELRAWLKGQPESAAGHTLLGYVLYRENKPKESLAEYTEAARRSTPDAEDLAVVAMDYVLLADYPDADKWLTRATEWDAGNALYWYYLGRTKYNENRFREAVTAFQKTLKLKPSDVRAEYNLGLSLAALGRAAEAAKAYRTAIGWEHAGASADPQPYLDLGLLLDHQEKTAEATPYLLKAVDLDPNNPKAREALGRNYEKLNQLSLAESEYKKAVALAPRVSALHFELGRVYRKEDRGQLAKKEFAVCAALDQAHSTDASETPNLNPRH